MSTLRFTKEQLIEALEARRRWAARVDKKNLAKHQRHEKAALVKFKAECRSALKWTYEDFKNHRGYIERIYPPSCPSSLVVSLDRQLRAIEASRQTRYVINDNGTWSQVHHLLTHDEDEKAEVC